MTAPALATARRGRPSAADLGASLAASRQVAMTLREKLRADRLEDRDFAANVRGHGFRIHWALTAGSLDAAMHEAAAIVAAADRHLRQRSGGAA